MKGYKEDKGGPCDLYQYIFLTHKSMFAIELETKKGEKKELKNIP